MNFQLPLTKRILSLIIMAIAVGCAKTETIDSAAPTPKTNNRIRFVCSKTYNKSTQKYIYSTVALNSERKRAIINWEREDFSGNGFPPQKRCEEVSPRFQKAYDQGNLNYFTEGKINGQPTICTGNHVGDKCNTLLITLKHQDNAQQTLEQLSDIFLGYATGAISQSSGEIAYSDDNRMFIKVDIEEFLSKPEQSN